MLIPGASVGPYRIIEQLGRGGMATVYKAHEAGLDRCVALKVLPPEFLHDTGFAERFQREARILARLEHPHIVPIYASGIDEGIPWMALRLFNGGSLAELIAGGRISRPRALSILGEAADALDYAHASGVLHRDVKPQNVLLDEKGHAFMADFGIAKIVESASTLTKTGMISGTPQYMAPEQARGTGVDQRTDIYALGVVAYELLAGRLPFTADTPVAVLMKHAQEPIPIPSRDQVPERLLRPVLKALAKSPADRWPSATAFVSALHAADQGFDAEIVEMRPRAAGEDLPTAEMPRMRAPASDAAEGPPEAGPAEPPRPASTGSASAWLRRRSPLLTGAILAAVALSATIWALVPHGTSRRGRWVVAVAPFYGPDEESAKEGRVMAALVEKAILQRLPSGDVTVLGIDETRQPVRDHAAARATGERLGATLVIWGEAFVLKGQAEVQPYLTMVRRDEASAASASRQQLLAGGLQAQELTTGTTLVEAQAANQLELRKTSAAGVGDLVLVLAAIQSLRADGKPGRALELLRALPDSAEVQRYRAEALAKMDRTADAEACLREAVRLDPDDTAAWEALGGLYSVRAQALVARRRRPTHWRNSRARPGRTPATPPPDRRSGTSIWTPAALSRPWRPSGEPKRRDDHPTRHAGRSCSLASSTRVSATPASTPRRGLWAAATCWHSIQQPGGYWNATASRAS